MIYRYYDNKEKLKQDLIAKFHDKPIDIQERGNNLIISLQAKQYVITAVNYDLPIRSFSIPFFPEDGLELITDRERSEIDDILESICNTYSNKEISAIIDDMQVCKWYSNANEGVLSNVAIIWRDHFLEENIGLLNGLVTMGVKPENMMVLDKGDKTKHQHEITETFKKMGFVVDVLDNAAINDIDKNPIAIQLITGFIESKRENKVIVIDDGAIVSKILNTRKFENVIGVIELTEMGLRRIRKLDEDLLYPVLNVAKTSLKRNLTYPEISNSIFVRIIELLGGEKLIGRSVLICGFGDLGSILADRLKNFGVRVSIFDPDIMKLIVASERGYNTYKSAIDAVKAERPFLVVGASGYNSLDENLIENLQDGSYVTAGATADLSVFLRYEQAGVPYKKIKNLGTQYLIKGKKISVLGNGRSVNLFESEAIPNRANDIFKAGILVTTKNLALKYQELKNVLDVENVELWISESGILEKYYDTYLDR